MTAILASALKTVGRSTVLAIILKAWDRELSFKYEIDGGLHGEVLNDLCY